MTRPPETVPEPAHGVAGWPFGEPEPAPALPGTLPDGRPWPAIRLFVLGDADALHPSESLASIERQDHPAVRSELVAQADLPGALAASDEPYLLLLRAGDLLAPGALAALALEAALTGAEAVAGLRVLFDRAVLGLDAPSLGASPDGRPDPTGGGILFDRAAVAALAGTPPALWWTRLAQAGAPLARIGRPVLLQRSAAPAAPAPSLVVVSLTGTGYGGGAGIAHRRLGEALALSGHRLRHLALSDESPPAAAEWADRFPLAETAIAEGGADFVLAGNLHGATRSLDALGRIAASVPTAAVLHDLFALTGRCAHPKGCTRIEAGCDVACPTPDEYPQLAPSRIASVHAGKRAVLAAPRAPLLLANSSWTEGQARAFAPAGARIAPLRLAVPANVFRPMDRASLRRALGLPEADVLVMFSAVIVDAPDKGFPDLIEALRRIARPGIGFVAIGRLDNPAGLRLPNLFSPGPIGEEERLAAWYGACDLHVTASRFETLGQTPIEAGLCGTPTLAYRLTGLTTSVIDGVSGRLVDPAPGALAAALEDLVADEGARRRLGAFGRIALGSRFSHAASALSLHEILVAEGVLGAAPPAFLPEMLGRFAFAACRAAGAGGTVEAPSPPLMRRLRQAKQAAFGRTLPLWMRRAMFAAVRMRQAARRLAG